MLLTIGKLFGGLIDDLYVYMHSKQNKDAEQLLRTVRLIQKLTRLISKLTRLISSNNCSRKFQIVRNFIVPNSFTVQYTLYTQHYCTYNSKQHQKKNTPARLIWNNKVWDYYTYRFYEHC